MANKRLIASITVAAGLLGGGAAGLVLGTPGVSGAQTTTTVPGAPSTTAPDSGATTPDRPLRGDRENCPDKEGGAEGRAPSGSGTSSNTGFRRGPGGRV